MFFTLDSTTVTAAPGHTTEQSKILPSPSLNVTITSLPVSTTFPPNFIFHSSYRATKTRKWTVLHQLNPNVEQRGVHNDESESLKSP